MIELYSLTMSQESHEPSQPTQADIEEAMTYKGIGNQLFKEAEYEQAIEMYSKAIHKHSNHSIFYSNRARCYFNLKSYEKCYQDAETAIKCDCKNIKAYCLSAESLVEIAMLTKDRVKIENAIEKLKKSLILCPSQGKNQFERQFVGKIYSAKKSLWELNSKEEADKKNKIRNYLVHLVESDKSLSQQLKDGLNQRILTLMDTSNDDKDLAKVPKALICPITKMLLKDPVCNEFGHSYSRKAYILYLETNENQDPITSKKITKNIMYPNINVKKAVQFFLQEHPWAYDEVIES